MKISGTFIDERRNIGKMSNEMNIQHVLQNADQLFDNYQYQEIIDLLKKYPVRFF